MLIHGGSRIVLLCGKEQLEKNGLDLTYPKAVPLFPATWNFSSSTLTTTPYMCSWLQTSLKQ